MEKNTKHLRNKYSSKHYLYTVKAYEVCFHKNIFAYSFKEIYCENHWKKEEKHGIPKLEYMCIHSSLIMFHCHYSLRRFLRFVM